MRARCLYCACDACERHYDGNPAGHPRQASVCTRSLPRFEKPQERRRGRSCIALAKRYLLFTERYMVTRPLFFASMKYTLIAEFVPGLLAMNLSVLVYNSVSES
jgi:hypothetical protein